MGNKWVSGNGWENISGRAEEKIEAGGEEAAGGFQRVQFATRPGGREGGKEGKKEGRRSSRGSR